jgi:hypothetical protein
MISKQEGLESLMDSARRHGFTFQKDSKNNIIVYHGTSEFSAKQIESTKYFKDGFFFHTDEGNFDSDFDNVWNYATIRAGQKGEKGNGEVLTMVVDPRCLLINGAGETESDGDLYLDTDEVWKTKEYLNKNIKEVSKNPELKSKEEIKKTIEDDLNVTITYKFAEWLLQTVRHYIYNKKINLDGVITAINGDLKYFYDISYEYKDFLDNPDPEMVDDMDKINTFKDFMSMWGYSDDTFKDLQNVLYMLNGDLKLNHIANIITENLKYLTRFTDFKNKKVR